MFDELLKKPKALALSVLFHAVIIGIIFLNFTFSDKIILVKQAELSKTVKAEVIDLQQLEQQKNKKKAAEEKRKMDLEKKKREKEAQKRKQQEQKKRKIEADKKKKDVEKKKQTEAKKLAAARKKAELEKKKEADKKRELAEQEKRKELEKQKKLEAEKQKKLAKEAEEKRLLEEKKKQEAEKRRLAEEEQKRRKQELNAQLEAEETQIRLNSLRQAYILAIRQKIERNWIRPQETGEMPACELKVVQGPGGIILNVGFGKCVGGSPTYRKSIENAVYKAGPLPTPGDQSLFERELNIFFNPG